MTASSPGAALRPRRRVRVRVRVATLSLVLLAFAGCSEEAEDGPTPAEVLTEAKAQLDETSGVTLALTTPELPDGVDGVLEANGVGTHAPAFEGALKISVSNVTVDVPVVAVGGVVHAKLPFTKSYAEVDPADYGAPDPAQLMSPETGVSSWLTAATELAEGEQTRDGELVLTSYAGTLPGSAVSAVIPSADESAEFAATFAVEEETGRLARAEVTGPFYGAQGDVEYTVALTDYGTAKDITAP